MEYRSRASVLGLPVVHISIGAPVQGQFRRGVATGWIAIGDVAIGVLLSLGGLSLGGICVGGVAAGVLPIGGCALGVIALGGLSLGYVAVGGAAFGWYTAVGGFAVAREFAIGGVALARHVIAPSPGGLPPVSSIPHPPFRWSDAALLIGILLALLKAALWVRDRRESTAPSTARR